MTALGRLAGNYVEAGWLLIAVAAALLFQVVSIRSFDFPRVILLMMLMPWLVAAAGIALAAGFREGSIRAAADASPLGRRLLPFTVAGVAAASWITSTVLSINPTISLWGSRFNSEGLLTALGYLSLFVLVATFLRRADQARRLIDVILLASVPVALYGIAQYYAYDPLAAAMSAQLAGGRIVSSLGNPILAGGYAAILMPLTLARAWDAWIRLRSAGESTEGSSVVAVVLPVAAIIGLQALALGFYLRNAAIYSQLWWVAVVPLLVFLLPALVVPRAAAAGRVGSAIALGGYAALFLLQFYLFFLARSRGPFVAAPVALGVTLFLLLRSRRARVALAAVGVGGTLLLLTFVGLPAAARAIPALADSPVIAALPGLGGQGNTVSSRWLIWQGVVNLALGQHDVGVPTADRMAWLRPLVGYGPETLAQAYERVATSAAREAEGYRISRAHSEPLDALASRGLLGLGIWLFTLAALALGTLRAWRRVEPALSPILAGAAGGVTAYTIEQLFEPNDPSLSLHFWLLAGVIVARALQVPQPDVAVTAQAPPERTRERARRRDRRPAPARPAPPVPVLGDRTAHRWAIGGLVLAAGLFIGMYTVLAQDYTTLGYLLVGWLALALAGMAWVFLPDAGVPSRAELTRGALFGLPLIIIAFLVSIVPFRRFEADAYSKYGLEAARRGDILSAFQLSRTAVALAPDEELLHSNLARALAAAANAAQDRPIRPDFRPSLFLMLAMQPNQLTTLSKREILVLTQTALEGAIAEAPLEPDNRLNLAIVHRALGDLGEPGRYELAREQLRLLQKISPTQPLYQQQLAEIANR